MVLLSFDDGLFLGESILIGLLVMVSITTGDVVVVVVVVACIVGVGWFIGVILSDNNSLITCKITSGTDGALSSHFITSLQISSNISSASLFVNASVLESRLV